MRRWFSKRLSGPRLWGFRRTLLEEPAAAFAPERVDAVDGRRDRDLDGRAVAGCDVAIGEWEGAGEGVHHGHREPRFQKERNPGRETDLLLVVPVLREIAREVEPRRGARLACPRHGEDRAPEGIRRARRLLKARSRPLEELRQDARAEPQARFDEPRVQIVQEAHEVSVAANRGGGRRCHVAVALGRDTAELAVEDVRGDLAHAPAGARRREIPGAGREAAEDAEELLLEGKKQVLDEGRRQRAGHA